MELSNLQFSPGKHLAPVIDWLNANFHGFFAAITRTIETMLSAVEGALLFLPAPGLIAVAAGLTFIALGWRLALLVAC